MIVVGKVTKGGKTRTFSRLEERRKRFDTQGKTAHEHHRPGSNSRRKQA